MRRIVNKKIIKNSFKSEFDVQGSYTGVSDDSYEKPIQDADDL